MNCVFHLVEVAARDVSIHAPSTQLDSLGHFSGHPANANSLNPCLRAVQLVALIEIRQSTGLPAARSPILSWWNFILLDAWMSELNAINSPKAITQCLLTTVIARFSCSSSLLHSAAIFSLSGHYWLRKLANGSSSFQQHQVFLHSGFTILTMVLPSNSNQMDLPFTLKVAPYTGHSSSAI